MLKKYIFATITVFTFLFSCSKENMFIKSPVIAINTYDAITGESINCDEFEHFTGDIEASINVDGINEINRNIFFQNLNRVYAGQFKKEGYFALIDHTFSEDDCDFNTFDVPMKKLNQLKVHLISDKPIANYSMEIHGKFGLSSWVEDRTYTGGNLFFSTEVLKVETINDYESFVYIPCLPQEEMHVSFIYSFGPGKGGGQVSKDFKTDLSEAFEIGLHFTDMH